MSYGVLDVDIRLMPGKTLFLTMEYVRGEDLKSFIHRSKALTVGTAVSVARQVAEGLAEAHKLGIVHRDLKPGNIMIDRNGNAKIMDFGIAWIRQERGMTGEGAVIGTPEYMSPEQVEGKTADARKLYERYLGYWKDGQIDLAEVARAGQRLAALRSRPAA